MRIDRTRLGIGIAVLCVALFVLMRVYVRGQRTGSAPGASNSGPTRTPHRPNARAWQPVYLSGGEVVARADAIGAFEGKVVSSDDFRGIAGAELTFVGPTGAESLKSEADGSFSLTPTREGRYELTLATAAGHLPLSLELGASPISLFARKGSGIRGVTIRLVKAVTYRGIVFDPEGKPVPKANVRIFDGDDFELALAWLPSTHVTDAKGEISFRAPDGAILEATHPGFGSGRARLGLSARQAGVVRIRLRRGGEREATATITGRVIDDTELAIPDAAVVARVDSDNPASEEALSNPGGRARTGADGAFSLVGLSPGRYVVTASDADHAPARLRGVTAGAPPITLVLVRGVRLSGRVTDAKSGSAIPAFALALGVREGPLAVHTEAVLSSFDAEGRYVIERLRPGTYLVTAAAAGFAPLERELTLSGDDQADFALEPGATAFGSVLDAKDSSPIANAGVALEGRLGSAASAPALVTTAVSDERGAFELSGIAAGTHSLFASAKGHHSRVIGGLVFALGQRVGPIAIDLTPTKEGEEPRIELFGIGAVLAAKDDVLVIGQTLPGGGAEQAGLVSGDAILAIDGEPVAGLGFEGAIQRIRGPEGTSVVLSVRKADAGAPIDVSVVRRRVRS